MSDMFDDFIKQDRLEGPSNKLTGQGLINNKENTSKIRSYNSSEIHTSNFYFKPEKKAFFSVKYIWLSLIIIAIILVIVFFIPI